MPLRVWSQRALQRAGLHVEHLHVTVTVGGEEQRVIGREGQCSEGSGRTSSRVGSAPPLERTVFCGERDVSLPDRERLRARADAPRILQRTARHLEAKHFARSRHGQQRAIGSERSSRRGLRALERLASSQVRQLQRRALEDPVIATMHDGDWQRTSLGVGGAFEQMPRLVVVDGERAAAWSTQQRPTARDIEGAITTRGRGKERRSRSQRRAPWLKHLQRKRSAWSLERRRPASTSPSRGSSHLGPVRLPPR
jgi:hypothetical protein